MAGPQNNFSAARAQVTVFDAEGNPHTTDRLNALDLVRSGGYHWREEDTKTARPEADGPENPSDPFVTIYAEDGTPHEDVARANAVELVNSGKFFWNPKGEAPEAVDAADAAEEPKEPAPAPEAPEEPVAPAPETINPVEEALEAQALRVAGSDDVVSYLEGFSLDALKTMAEERYGEKIHHRASKETAIQKIVELEEARLVGDDQADA